MLRNVFIGVLKADQLFVLCIRSVMPCIGHTCAALHGSQETQHFRPIRSGPTFATMSAPSRFVSQDEVNEEGKRRDQELKEVYEW